MYVEFSVYMAQILEQGVGRDMLEEKKYRESAYSIMLIHSST